MKNHLLLLVLVLLLVRQSQAQTASRPRLALTPYVTGLTRPVDIENAGDGRLFIVEKPGRIRIVNSAGALLPTPFLDIVSQVLSTGNEQGMLGLAFHPNYATNGYFYVNYIDRSNRTHIARFQRSATDPNLADPTSELLLIQIPQPFSNHKGGCVKFGPDGYLYAGLGDGGSGGDPGNRAQNLNELLGKILRIDVDTTTGTLPYGIPPTNPFVGSTTARPEIWAWGVRNPWRFSFDSQTGDLWIGEVGQNAWEEVDVVPDSLLNSTQLNMGWRCYEGTHAYNTTVGCVAANTYYQPIFEYSHSVGQSITGGYVYRGTQSPTLTGRYVFADYVSGKFWTTSWQNGAWLTLPDSLMTHPNVVTFGLDSAREMYCVEYSQSNNQSRILHVTAIGPTGLGSSAAEPRLLVVPNPATGLCWVELPVAAAIEVRLLSPVTGQVVRRTRANPATASAQFDVRGLAAGLYVVQADVAGQLLTRRLMVLPE